MATSIPLFFVFTPSLSSSLNLNVISIATDYCSLWLPQQQLEDWREEETQKESAESLQWSWKTLSAC